MLEDPVALRIVGEEALARIESDGRRFRGRASRSVRAFMAVRSRFAEDQLAEAVARGASQYVILGAGLDTFPYRNPHEMAPLRIFEVDHPATQDWKRQRLAAAGIQVPGSVTFAPVNFERQLLRDGLAAAGFDFGQATFFSWLGVTMYLTRKAMLGTLEFIASLGRSGVVFDYALPRASLNWWGRMAFDFMARRVARAGEPFQLFFEPAELAAELRRMGFGVLEDLGPEELNARYFENRADALKVRGKLGRLLSARV